MALEKRGVVNDVVSMSRTIPPSASSLRSSLLLTALKTLRNRKHLAHCTRNIFFPSSVLPNFLLLRRKASAVLRRAKRQRQRC